MSTTVIKNGATVRSLYRIGDWDHVSFFHVEVKGFPLRSIKMKTADGEHRPPAHYFFGFVESSGSAGRGIP